MALAGMRSDCRLHDVLEMRAGRRGLLGCALCCTGHASCPRPAVTVMAHLKVRSWEDVEDPAKARSADVGEGRGGRRARDAAVAQGPGEVFEEDVEGLGEHDVPDSDKHQGGDAGIGRAGGGRRGRRAGRGCPCRRSRGAGRFAWSSGSAGAVLMEVEGLDEGMAQEQELEVGVGKGEDLLRHAQDARCRGRQGEGGEGRADP